MRFQFVEQQAWVRTGTHTVIPQRDPDFERFRGERSGSIVRLLRVWCDAGGDGAPGNWYLGACLCTPGRFGSDLRRVLRRVGALATTAEPARSLRAALARSLRRAIA